MAEVYRKKPIEIEANELTRENAEAVALWCGGRLVEEIDPHTPTNKYAGINIPTLEGVMRASEGDFIIKGVHGEFYPCKASIFKATYDKVE